MPVLSTIAFSVCEASTLLLLHGRTPPSAPDWAQWVELIRATRAENLEMAALIVTPFGAGPNASQRKLVNDALDGQPHAVAVMSDHRATRVIIITAFSWFNSGLKSFRSADFAGATRHLGLRDEWAEHLASEVMKLDVGLAQAADSARSR